MKKFIVSMIVFLAVGMVIAVSESEKQGDSKGDTPAVRQQQPGRPGQGQAGRSRGPVDHQQRYQQMLSRREDVHKKSIAELEAIKKIAEEEGATRTVEAIQKMIDKKNTDYQQAIERFERARKERMQRTRRQVEKDSVNKPVNDNTTEQE
jgi:hypothetical protein